jgi:hypothetical protein
MTVDASKGRVCHRRLYSGETGGQTVLGQCVLTRQPRVSTKTLASLPIDPTKRPNLDFCQSRHFRHSSSCGLHRAFVSPDMCAHSRPAFVADRWPLLGPSGSCVGNPRGTCDIFRLFQATMCYRDRAGKQMFRTISLRRPYGADAYYCARRGRAFVLIFVHGYQKHLEQCT